MINVSVKLYGTLRRRSVGIEEDDRQPFTVQAPDGATVSYLLAELGVSHAYVGAVAINGEAATVDMPLQDGDDVRLFPPSAGG